MDNIILYQFVPVVARVKSKKRVPGEKPKEAGEHRMRIYGAPLPFVYKNLVYFSAKVWYNTLSDLSGGAARREL